MVVRGRLGEGEDEADDFVVVDSAGGDAVALEEEVVEAAVDAVDGGGGAVDPVLLFGFVDVEDFGAERVEETVVFLFREGGPGVGQDVGEDGLEAGVAELRAGGGRAGAVGPVVGLGLAAYAEQVGEFVGEEEGVLAVGGVVVDLDLGEEGTDEARDAYGVV